ncbi:putative receptor-like protein kinase At1g72540 [Tribolium madens]|uniref:putative receptor-like protein kinase At1g72540 n=1 Tax=Tribolium madens TaxID=41895 RepID=UPI001CF7592C|nr:putative receptor-like protein kinase At1g72540 [Tribolium madens]
MDLEIRKLPLDIRSRLISLLELQDSWKKLMAMIPETLLLNNYKCDISHNNPAKYRSEHFHIIEDNSIKKRIFCSEILLREWGTSGRVRPAVGHLKYLLERAELFRAADYIAVDVLKQEPPPRPTKGPAAPVVINPDELEDPETKRIEKILDEINYPSSAIENINKLNSINTNLNYSTKKTMKVIPKIIISESPDMEETPPQFRLPVVIQNEKIKSESDLIKFSQESVSNSDNNANVPHLSSLLTDEASNNNIPAVIADITSSELSSETIASESNNSVVNRPNLSSLLNQSSDDSEPNFNLPAISELSLSSNSGSSTNFPALSQLIESENKSTSKNSRSCSSPLPNLSLNTPLPHFTYCDLATATNNFDETPLAQGGRFLGSGAFGKVYLGVGLTSKPVAVKKVILENVDVVRVDDMVTKQFRNEVEILSKYEHENLVALRGYSCDGDTYCLLYEYVPGGALKDRLQKHELIWTERLYIAIGTARAIAYLHTAYATPLIHRDIKTANILLDSNNKPKLCDFGLIKRALNQNTNTASTIFGTSAYMAPEAFRGDVSVRLDTFSFGVVLLELLTSMPPMDESREGVDLVTHIQENCQNGIKPLLDIAVGSWLANNINFGEKLFEIAMDCLKDKKERPTMTTICGILGDLVHKSL